MTFVFVLITIFAVLPMFAVSVVSPARADWIAGSVNQQQQ
jgi:hypothetical protein